MQPQLSLICIKASKMILLTIMWFSLYSILYVQVAIVVSRDTEIRRSCMSSESMEARQRSYDLGIHLGYQRRNKEVIAWAKKRRRTIRREELISFLCGKVPPPRTARAPPRVSMVSASRPSPPETGSSVETDLQPFREAIALHG